MSIAAVYAADKDEAFRPPPAAQFVEHQTNDRVTIGAETYIDGEKLKAAFGKLKPYQYGVLPVLIAIRNDSKGTINLDHIRAEYVGPHGDRVEATPAKDVQYARAPKRPGVQGPLGPIPIKGKKNPLTAWEIEGRAFSAQALPSGNSAFGFLYFQTGWQPGSTIYLTGLSNAATGTELLFFEIPLK